MPLLTQVGAAAGPGGGLELAGLLRPTGIRLKKKKKSGEGKRFSPKCSANQLLLKPLNLPRLILSLQSMFLVSLGDASEDKIVGNMTQLHYNSTYVRSGTGWLRIK